MENQPDPTLNPHFEPVPESVPVEEKRAGSKLPLIIGSIVAVIALMAGLGFVYLRQLSATKVVNSSSPTNNATASTTPATATPSPTPSPTKVSVKEEGKIILTGGYADASIAKTATGYRMYVNRQSGGPAGYLTYSSTDGIDWKKEKDMVISGVATGRAVVLPTGVRFYYPGVQPINPTDPPANLFSSFSPDGTTFTKDAGIRIEPREGYYVEGPTVFQLADGTWRMYFNENSVAAGNRRDGEIWGATSTDGLTWVRDTTSTIKDETPTTPVAAWKQALHPYVVTNPKGGFLMFYNTHSEVYAASSSDGLTCTKLGKVGIRGADVDGYFQEDGTFQVFYGDFSEATQGVIYMGVLEVN